MIRKIRAVLATAILFAVTLRVLLWAVEPFISYLIVGLVLTGILGFMHHRKIRW